MGTRVHIQKGEKGGKISIDFLSDEDLNTILDLIQKDKNDLVSETTSEESVADTREETDLFDDRSKTDKEDDDLYFIKNFSI